MHHYVHVLVFLHFSFFVTMTGCSGKSDTDGTPGSSEPFKLADLVEDFDPPPLEELEAIVEWVDKPVLDSMQLMREHKAQQGEPELTVQQALTMKNDSSEANRLIREAMGRLPASKGAVNYEAEMIRHAGGDVKSTNPLMMSSTAEFDVNGLIGIGLFGFDWSFEPFAASASVKTWQSSSDGMYDKVVMRDDLTWSDGKPITAHDVAFSFKVIMSSKVPIPAVRSGTEQLKYVKAYDDHTVVFFHKEPLATNVWNVNFPIIPKHVYESSVADDPTLEQSEYHVKVDRNPTTGGMFTITSRERGQQIVLRRRESYYMHNGKQVRPKPHFETIRFKVIQDNATALLALKKGDIEEMELTPEQWQTQTTDSAFYDKNTKARETEWVYFYFGWNCKSGFFRDKRVRRAMSYAFDHETMINRHRYGLDEPCTGIFHPESRWYPEGPITPYKQDLAKAEQLLAAAGWEDHDGDGWRDKEVNGEFVKFEFTMLVSQRQDRIDICDMLRENLERIGVICNVQPMEFTVLQDRSRNHKFQAIMAGWGTGTDPDTSENLWTTDAIDNGRNYVQYSNPRVDELFEAGKRELDPQKREAVYAEIHKILWEDQPYTWLYFRNAYYAFNKSLRGYNFSPRGPYNYGPGFDSIWKPAMQ